MTIAGQTERQVQQKIKHKNLKKTHSKGDHRLFDSLPSIRKNNRRNNTSSNRGLVKWKRLYDLETPAFNQGDGLERATFFSFSKTEVSAVSSM